MDTIIMPFWSGFTGIRSTQPGYCHLHAVKIKAAALTLVGNGNQPIDIADNNLSAAGLDNFFVAKL